MPIAATTSVLQAQIKNALSLKQAATPDLVGTIIASALAGIAPSGLFPAGFMLVPLVPAGYAVTQSMISLAFNLKPGANKTVDSKMFSLGIAALCPIVPPIGLTLLEVQLSNSMDLKQAATPDLVATLMANAIISYFMSGGVV